MTVPDGVLASKTPALHDRFRLGPLDAYDQLSLVPTALKCLQSGIAWRHDSQRQCEQDAKSQAWASRVGSVEDMRGRVQPA
jgi:hypothetical protein